MNTDLFKLHYVWVHQGPVIHDFTLHILGNLQEHKALIVLQLPIIACCGSHRQLQTEYDAAATTVPAQQ